MSSDPRDALVSISFRPGNIQALINRVRQDAAQIRAAALAANMEIAKGMQATALENLKQSLSPRPQRPSQYLIRAVERADFVNFNEAGFDFATPAFLHDPTINSYWRGIEFGSTKFMGREVFGFFSGNGGIHAPSSDRYQADPRMMQIRSPRNPGRFPAFRILIEKPIVEHKFLRNTIREYDGAMIDAIYRRHLARWMG